MSRKSDQSRTCCRSWRDPRGSDQATPSPSHCSHLKFSSSIFPSKTRKSYKRLKQLTFWAAPLDCRNAYSALNIHLLFNCACFCICNYNCICICIFCLQLFLSSHLHYSVELWLNVELRMLCLDALQLDCHWNHFLKVTSQTNHIVSLDRPYIPSVYNIPSSPVEMLVPR